MSDWAGALAECDSLERFNDWALPTARELRGGFARLVATEAIKRGYRYFGDKDTGLYVDLTPEDYQMVIAELENRERKESMKRLWKQVRKTRIPMVMAAWEEWVYKSSAAESLGVMVIQDFRQRKDNDFLYEFDQVPETIYKRLFQSDAKDALKQIYTIFAGQGQTEIRNWKEAV